MRHILFNLKPDSDKVTASIWQDFIKHLDEGCEIIHAMPDGTGRVIYILRNNKLPSSDPLTAPELNLDIPESFKAQQENEWV